MGRARRFNNYTDDVRKARDIVKEYGQFRQGKIGIGSSFRTSPFGVITGNSGAKTDSDKLSLFFGGEIGAGIGWTAQTDNIDASYNLDISTNSAGDQTQIRGLYFISSSTESTLENVINGQPYDGQQVILTGISGQTAITIVHAAGGAGQVLCPGDVNFTLNDDESVLLIDDVTAATQTYRIMASSEVAAGGGVTFPIVPTIRDFGTTSGTLNLKLDGSDAGDGHSFKVTANGNVTLTFDNPPATGIQQEFEVEFVQDATGGRTLTLPVTVVETVSISTGANSITILTFRTNDGGTNYHAIPALRGTISLGGVSALTPWTEDIDADGFDLQDLSNIEFRSTTGTPAASTPAIHVDASGDMILNVALADQIFNTINDVIIGQFGQIGGNNDSFFQITSIDSALPLLKFFNDDSTMTAGAQAGRIEFFSNDGGGASIIYADIRVDTENVTAANEAGSMFLGATINGDVSTTTFLSLNNANDDKITAFKILKFNTGIDIEMVTNDIWMDEVADGTRVFGTATALSFDVAGTFVGSFSSSALSLQGNTTLSIPELFTMTDTGATPGSTIAAIWQNTGGMNFQTGNVGDDFDFQFAGGSDLLIKEDGELQFNTVGKQHKIVPNVSSLDIVAENETDSVKLITGTGRDNESLRCGDLSSSFKNEPADAAYELFVENTVAVTTSQPKACVFFSSTRT